jgi:hypothetical protein
VAFFFQFKIPEVMRRKSWLITGGRLSVPFYRMNLRHEGLFAQHRGLLACESYGKTVYYVCPRFHTNLELDHSFSKGEIHQLSAWFRPSKVTPPDYNSRHGAVYDYSGTKAEVRSKDPYRHEGHFDFATFARDWRSAVELATRQSNEEFFGGLVQELRSAGAKTNEELVELQAELADRLRDRQEGNTVPDTSAAEPSSILGLPPPPQSEAMKAQSLARSLFGLEILVGGRD